MANELTNRKFFTIIHASLPDLLAIEPTSMGVCERCNRLRADGYIVPVLGHYWMCPDCFEDWYKTAVRELDDVRYEHAIYREYVARFRAVGRWCDTAERKEKREEKPNENHN